MNELDKQIIRLATQGDADAFTQLVRNYKHYVFQTAFGILGDASEAEDVSQEAFLRAYDGLQRLRKLETFPSWIATIATRIALDTIRKRRREIPVEDEKLTDNDRQTTNPFQDAENRLDVSNLLKQLNVDERTVIVLRELQDKSYAEMADILNIPIGTVRSRLHSARHHMRDAMNHWNRGRD